MIKLMPVMIPVTLSYSGGVASGQVPQLTKGSSKCAVIGIGFNATDMKYGLFNKLAKFTIGADNYVQGDGVMMGLLGTGVAPMGAADDYGWNAAPFFPGTQLMLLNGRLVGGMPVRGGVQINYRIDDLSAAAGKPLTEMIIYMVQFPPTPEGEMLWKSFIGGRGVVQIVGQDYLQTSGTALTQSTDTFTLQPVHDLPVRRSAQLGMADDESSAGHDAANVQETEFRLGSALTFMNTEHPPSKQPVPVRAIFGNALQGYDTMAAVDSFPNGKNVIQLSAPAPAADLSWRFATFFEGIDPSDADLCGQTAVM